MYKPRKHEHDFFHTFIEKLKSAFFIFLPSAALRFYSYKDSKMYSAMSFKVFASVYHTRISKHMLNNIPIITII